MTQLKLLDDSQHAFQLFLMAAHLTCVVGNSVGIEHIHIRYNTQKAGSVGIPCVGHVRVKRSNWPGLFSPDMWHLLWTWQRL